MAALATAPYSLIEAAVVGEPPMILTPDSKPHSWKEVGTCPGRCPSFSSSHTAYILESGRSGMLPLLCFVRQTLEKNPPKTKKNRNQVDNSHKGCSLNKQTKKIK